MLAVNQEAFLTTYGLLMLMGMATVALIITITIKLMLTHWMMEPGMRQVAVGLMMMELITLAAKLLLTTKNAIGILITRNAFALLYLNVLVKDAVTSTAVMNQTSSCTKLSLRTTRDKDMILSWISMNPGMKNSMHGGMDLLKIIPKRAMDIKPIEFNTTNE